MENLETLMEFPITEARKMGYTKKQLYNLTMACEEIVVNVISYAYPDKEGDIEIEYRKLKNKKGLEIDFVDWGIPFNPLEKEAPDLKVPIEDRKIGGLGIHLVSKTMDEVFYKRMDDMNCLTIKLTV